MGKLTKEQQLKKHLSMRVLRKVRGCGDIFSYRFFIDMRALHARHKPNSEWKWFQEIDACQVLHAAMELGYITRIGRGVYQFTSKMETNNEPAKEHVE